MARFAVAAAAVLASAEAQVRNYEVYDFSSYKKEFGKGYTGDEHDRRQAIFEGNLAKIKQHNAEYSSGKHTWYASVNELADFTSEEFAKLRAAKYSPSSLPILTSTTNTK